MYEHKQSYNIKEFKPLTIGIEEINELLDHIDSKFNTGILNKPINPNKNKPKNQPVIKPAIK